MKYLAKMDKQSREWFMTERYARIRARQRWHWEQIRLRSMCIQTPYNWWDSLKGMRL